MRLIRLILLLIVCPIMLWAQNGVITGKVLKADVKTPIAGASVFLGNSSFTTTTGTDGTFALKNLKPGQYSLVINAAGFEDKTQTVVIGNEPIEVNIELSPRPIQLKEVTVSTISKSEWKQALAQFKIEFIGEDENAQDCKIINPEVLNFSYHQNKNVLEAYTSDFLIVENNALGYRIKFLLKDFKSDHISGNVNYTGQRVFEELNAREGKKKKWYAKRDEAYYGSAMHFYRSLYKDSLAGSGFKVLHLVRTVNTKRPSNEVIQQNLEKSKALKDNSYLRWFNLLQSSVYAKQTLVKGQVKSSDIVHKTDKPGIDAIIFSDYLYVIYTKRWESSYFKDIYRSPGMLNYETTIIAFTPGNQGALFDENGTVIGDSPMYEGTWSKARLSTLLPVDYTPYNLKK